MKKFWGLLLVGLMAFAVVASGCIGGGGGTTTSGGGATTQEKVTLNFLSTQLNPPEERAFVKDQLLKEFTRRQA